MPPSKPPHPDPVGFAVRRAPGRTPEGALVVVLEGDLDVDGAPDVVHAVCDALTDGDVALDLGGVTFVALAGLDALASLAVAARERQRRLHVLRCSRAVTRAAGLAARLGVEVALDGL